MSEPKIRTLRIFTTKHPTRFLWHTGVVFGKELCIGVDSWRIFGALGFSLWEITFSFVKRESTLKGLEVYERGDPAQIGMAK